MRIIQGIIAFTITFGLSASLMGLLFGYPQTEVRSFVQTHSHSSADSKNISNLLSQDVRNGDIRDETFHKLYNGEGNFDAIHKNPEYSQAITGYYHKSARLNDSNLPEDFKYAWREHMNAWKLQTVYLKAELNDSEYNSLSDNTNEINRTWFQVLRIAKRYGVRIPSSYYR